MLTVETRVAVLNVDCWNTCCRIECWLLKTRVVVLNVDCWNTCCRIECWLLKHVLHPLGPVIGRFCIDLAIKKAKEAGIGWVSARSKWTNSNYYRLKR